MTDKIQEIRDALKNKMAVLEQRIEVRKNPKECNFDETERLKAFHERLAVYEEVEPWLSYLLTELDAAKQENERLRSILTQHSAEEE